jgi:hypothetical protein
MEHVNFCGILWYIHLYKGKRCDHACDHACDHGVLLPWFQRLLYVQWLIIAYAKCRFSLWTFTDQCCESKQVWKWNLKLICPEAPSPTPFCPPEWNPGKCLHHEFPHNQCVLIRNFQPQLNVRWEWTWGGNELMRCSDPCIIITRWVTFHSILYWNHGYFYSFHFLSLLFLLHFFMHSPHEKWRNLYRVSLSKYTWLN